MKRIILTLLVMFSFAGVFAQEVEFTADRPGASTGHSPVAFAALCLGCSLTEELGCFVESYNYFGKAGNQFCADFGFNYMVARKVQLDVAANLDLCDPAHCWAVSFSVAWQINK